MIISGLAEILIRAAEGEEAVFALPGHGKAIRGLKVYCSPRPSKSLSSFYKDRALIFF